MGACGGDKKDANKTAQVQQESWHVMDCESVAAKMETDMAKGLTAAEAAARLEKYGPNKLTEARKATMLERIWRQVNNVLVLILAIVAVVSCVKGGTSEGEERVTSFIEVALIVGVIILNTWIGIRQEGSAEKSADALKAMLSSDATVIRDGTRQGIPAENVVVGDLVVLGTGDRIPADIRLVKVSNLASQEAALTGESLPVEKKSDKIEASNPSSVPLGDRKNMAFSATLVSQGEAIGIVVACGDDTEIGEINSLVSQVESKKTAVLVQIDIVSKWIAIFVVCTAIVTFLVYYFHVPGVRNGHKALEGVSTALVTSVAMIPEGLAAIVTLTYAYAVSNMAKHNAIVRVLPAVETLGSVTVICSDKTGTLTKNEMTLTCFVTSNARYKFNTDATERTPSNFVREDSFMAHTRKKGEVPDAKPEEVKPEVNESSGDAATSPVSDGESPSFEFLRSALAGGIVCSNAMLGTDGGRDGEIGNPTEIAIVRAAYFSNADYVKMREEQPVINQVPFSSEYKFMATLSNPIPELDKIEDGVVVHVKGAPDRLIAMASHQAKNGDVGESEPINRDYWLDAAHNLSSHGLRCLALCRAVVPADAAKPGENLGPEFVQRDEPWLTIVGICAIVDPPRPECVQAIKEAHGAGVTVKMITGDHRATALAIGDQLGIVDAEHPDAITGPELDDQSDEELRKTVLTYNVFARASPENKIRIVKALQAEGQVSSMTGDGVNDAPALKAADMGVAMGKEGTDVAREAAEMILADDNFATIVRAVKEGRAVWDNLRKVLLFNTPVNNAQGMTVLFGIICGLEFSPLSPIQVLYCNLICAVTLGFVLAVEVPEKGIMSLPPRRVGKRLIGRFLLLRIAIGTVTLVATTVGSVFIMRGFTSDYLIDDCPRNDSADAETLFDESSDCFSSAAGQLRSQASNTLTFGAISIMLSARFAYNSSLHPRIFRGNKYAWYSVAIVVVLQIMITYIPGLNDVVFGMKPQNGIGWGFTILFMIVDFLVMEAEKAIRRHLKGEGYDTDDTQPDPYLDDDHVNAPEEPYAPPDSVRSATMHSNTVHH
ncbi:Calcium-transporting ATPase 1 [Hondaea fermentalgiana]|uniref:Calcium-transporting ATPase 1 n=1 Tax=Hondaea fermentalgiana TaxID=2315210 RepID=A0A2R5G3I4_9STRA|nr:Calcium-transporting ATPase 1 [Hondaea fermentalgiana]|eukprot:GBG24879.1 Calcium-transporting ATPase 1 [Hondaea fermentalgiana]